MEFCGCSGVCVCVGGGEIGRNVAVVILRTNPHPPPFLPTTTVNAKLFRRKNTQGFPRAGEEEKKLGFIDALDYWPPPPLSSPSSPALSPHPPPLPSSPPFPPHASNVGQNTKNIFRYFPLPQRPLAEYFPSPQRPGLFRAAPHSP